MDDHRTHVDCLISLPSDFSLSLDASHPNYKHEKLAFKDQASSFWRLVKMNSPEGLYALIGSIGSFVCGSLSIFCLCS